MVGELDLAGSFWYDDSIGYYFEGLWLGPALVTGIIGKI